TAVGALAGAALGGSNGAAAGAGVGLLFGSVSGADAANRSGYTLQQRYDNAYVQCMYAKGNKVPQAGLARSGPPIGYAPPRASSAPLGANSLPPPPPGYAWPPPPPRAVR
ncbi:MAG: hypothetical protein H7125_06325, partial [Proteobacteria bacterium]|nr:hypothetical protein [Burkholderiales bacterium]